MNKIMKFKVEIEGLEEKIWRDIEIADHMTIADLAYTILASFNSLAYHLYKIDYNNVSYCSSIDADFALENEVEARDFKLENFNFKAYDKMIMEYDFGSPTTFIITYFGSRNINRKDAYIYPLVIAGQGNGMLDDITCYELKEIVDETDKLGYSNYSYTPGYEKNTKYDYRNYNLKSDNLKLKGLILLIKNGYEVK